MKKQKKVGTLIVSLDFELYWGMCGGIPFDTYKVNVLGGRKAIPKMLDIFKKHDIHATWATVGFMFAESKKELLEYLPKEKLRPSYINLDYSRRNRESG